MESSRAGQVGHSSILRLASWAFILHAFSGAPTASSATFVFSDFDETLMRCRGGGIFKTPVKLFQINNRNNMLQAPMSDEREIVVSCSDLDRLLPFLAQDERYPGAIGYDFELEDGHKIVPGHYHLVPSRSFYPYFFENPRGKSYLMEALEPALQAVKSSNDSKKMAEKLFGDAWPIAQVWLSGDAQMAKRFAFTTARAHSMNKEWPEFFQSLIKNSDISGITYEPNYKMSMGVSRPEFDQYDRDPTHIAERKVKSLYEFAEDLRKVRVLPKDVRLNEDGTGEAAGHTLVFMEDNQKTLLKMAKALRALVLKRIVPLKVVLLNFGTDAEVLDAAQGGMPRYSVITTSGTFREATAHEVFGEHPSLTPAKAQERMKYLPKQVSASSCSSLLKPHATQTKEKQ